ncbi:hypothetical protein KCP71_25185 [Salmonella enterica subsp. enterica]|nr:hypothetical protein KCP71_25185 [Salmonella enterica subsp. enterica]
MRQVWIRANGTVPDDIRVHQYLLICLPGPRIPSPSRFSLTRHRFSEKGIQTLLIDHSCGSIAARSILMNGLLYSVESTSASSARGFVRGEFYTQDGALVASTVQKGNA